jgi:hypothetical protein
MIPSFYYDCEDMTSFFFLSSFPSAFRRKPMPLSCQNLSTEVKRGSVVSFPIHQKSYAIRQELFFSLAPAISITRSGRITRMENVETKKKKKKFTGGRMDGWKGKWMVFLLSPADECMAAG